MRLFKRIYNHIDVQNLNSNQNISFDKHQNTHKGLRVYKYFRDFDRDISSS